MKEVKDTIGELVGEVRIAMKETEERMKNQRGGGPNEDIEKIIKKAVQDLDPSNVYTTSKSHLFMSPPPSTMPKNITAL